MFLGEFGDRISTKSQFLKKMDVENPYGYYMLLKLKGLFEGMKVRRAKEVTRNKIGTSSQKASARKNQPSEEPVLLCEQRLIHLVDVKSARKGLISQAVALQLAENLAFLGDSTRLRILSALSNHELCVCDIAATLGISESTVSHQLRGLKAEDFVLCRKEGRIAYYRLRDPEMSELHSKLQEIFEDVQSRKRLLK